MAADVTVKAVLAEGGTLSGEYTTPDNVALVAGNRVLVPKDASPTANDLYRVAAGPWSRATDVPLSRWMDILVENGDAYGGKSGWAGSIWTLSTQAPYARDGSAPLHFEPRQKQPHPRFLEGLEETLEGQVRLPERTGVEGTYARIGGTITKHGVITNVFETETGGSYREGLELLWDSAAGITVRPGSAFVPGSGQVDLAAAVPLAFPDDAALSASTWYYLYLHDDNGTPQIEVSSQRPASPYIGRARVKGGGTGGVLNNLNPDEEPDDTRRYIGVLRTGAALNTLLRFYHEDDWIYYGESSTTVNLPSAATGFNTRDLSSRVPPTAISCLIHGATNNSAALEINLDRTGATSQSLVFARLTATNIGRVMLTDAQALVARNSATGGDSNVTVLGYPMGR